jgi:hypothetical protein
MEKIFFLQSSPEVDTQGTIHIFRGFRLDSPAVESTSG